MEALILSCSTGGGHNAAAAAVKGELEKRGHHVTMMDPYELVSRKLAEEIGALYVRMVQRMPRMFGVVYSLGSVVRRVPGKSPVYYANIRVAKRLRVYLKQHPTDVILMPHLYPAELITYLKGQGDKLPLSVFIATDYTCIPFTEETDCDYYVIPGEKQIAEFRKRRIPAEKLLPFGIPVAMACDTDLTKQQARQALGLSEDLVYILLTGGSIGAGNIEEKIRRLLRYLKKSGKQGKIIAVCGSNDKLYDRLQAAYGEKLVLLHRTRQMALYMRACDLFLSKPGGLSSTEAAVLHVPYIQIAPIPGCETKNMQFFAKNGMSIAVKHPSLQLKRAVNKLLREEDARRQKSSQFLIPQDARAALCDWLEEKLQQQTDKQE